MENTKGNEEHSEGVRMSDNFMRNGINGCAL